MERRSVLIVVVLHSYGNGSARSLVESFAHEAKELEIILGNGEVSDFRFGIKFFYRFKT